MAFGYGASPYETIIRFSDPPKSLPSPIRLAAPLASPNPDTLALHPVDDGLGAAFESVTGISLRNFISPAVFLDHAAFATVTPTRTSTQQYEAHLTTQVREILDNTLPAETQSDQLAALAADRVNQLANTLDFYVQIENLEQLTPGTIAHLLAVAAAGRDWFSRKHDNLTLHAPHLVEQEWFHFYLPFTGPTARDEAWSWTHRKDTYFDLELNERVTGY